MDWSINCYKNQLGLRNTLLKIVAIADVLSEVCGKSHYGKGDSPWVI